MSRRVVSLVAVSRVTFVTNIYVGDLAFGATDDDLRSAFEQFGEVTSVNIIMDRDTGRSRGFAFVEMANAEEAKEAIESLDGTDIAGRNVKVNEARPREPRSGGGGGYGGGRGGGGGGYGGGGGGAAVAVAAMAAVAAAAAVAVAATVVAAAVVAAAVTEVVVVDADGRGDRY